MDSRRELEGGEHRVLERGGSDLILEVQREGLFEVLEGAIDRLPLARYLNFEAACNEPVAFMGDRGRELHAESIGPGCDETSPVPPAIVGVKWGGLSVRLRAGGWWHLG